MDCLNLAIKNDSFVVEKDVHFPTDMNLLWDSGRKCLETIRLLKEEAIEITGWRLLNSWYKKLRISYRKCSDIHRKKGGNYERRIKVAALEYLKVSGQISEKLAALEREGALYICLLYTSPSPRDKRQSRMPSSA